ncbi:MAG: 30S ribosomal protein S12 methylthiotransferase RimO [Tetrasphaera sp.]|nr:30S ribosomal protein S12 methylthiotransferase RimO [Tetrasphaera sp.]
MSVTPTDRGSVALVTLGCTRNEVDSEELAGRLSAAGWHLVADAADADVALVNTCGFIESAKKDSIDTLLEAAALKESGRTQAVVAVGCLAERYGRELAAELPEADAVLGFDAYADLSSHLSAILAGEQVAAHTPADRRHLLPITPLERGAAAGSVEVPGHASASGEVIRALLEDRVWAPLKIASGCDRRCAFCAIPSFRGAFLSRRPHDVLAEARWLAASGVRELLLVSENSTSYGKDLGDLTLLESLLPELTAIEGIERVRVSYLQPAEIRPGLLAAMAQTPGVMPWYDLSFQHASTPLLRRMRRFGGSADFLTLIETIRSREPLAGIRSNVIVGFPGESEADLAELTEFLTQARLDVVGVFGYSDEDGTEAVGLDGHLSQAEVDARVAEVSELVEELMAQRAEDRIGEEVEVLIEGRDEDGQADFGRAAHQGPDVDGQCRVLRPTAAGALAAEPGQLVRGRVVSAEGVDLVVEAR